MTAGSGQSKPTGATFPQGHSGRFTQIGSGPVPHPPCVSRPGHSKCNCQAVAFSLTGGAMEQRIVLAHDGSINADWGKRLRSAHGRGPARAAAAAGSHPRRLGGSGPHRGPFRGHCARVPARGGALRATRSRPARRRGPLAAGGAAGRPGAPLSVRGAGRLARPRLSRRHGLRAAAAFRPLQRAGGARGQPAARLPAHPALPWPPPARFPIGPALSPPVRRPRSSGCTCCG